MLVRIKNQLQKICNPQMLKVLFYTGLSTLVRMLTGLVSIKVIAVILGPAGVALIGQLISFSTIVSTGATGGISQGVTKYIAECKDSLEVTKKIISTGFRITLYCSLLTGLLMILFHSMLSQWILHSSQYGYLFILFGVVIWLHSLNVLITSILNGYKEFKKIVSAKIISSVVGLIFTLILVFTMGLHGALISAVTIQSLLLFVTLWVVRRLFWFKWKYFKEKIDTPIAKKYARYTLMTVVSTSIAPISQLLLRGYVMSSISPVQAGWWEAMNKLSNVYLTVITASFSIYYLPRLSELKDKQSIRAEILSAYKLICPLLAIVFPLIYLCRTFIVKILFTDAFLPMQDFFVWQLIGDFFMICSWLLAYLMIAKSMTKAFIITEVSTSVSFLMLGFLFIHINGTIGLTQAYAINYFFFFIGMLIFFRKLLRSK